MTEEMVFYQISGSTAGKVWKEREKTVLSRQKSVKGKQLISHDGYQQRKRGHKGFSVLTEKAFNCSNVYKLRQLSDIWDLLISQKRRQTKPGFVLRHKILCNAQKTR